MEWKYLEAVIPAVMSIPERAESIKELLIQLSKQCPGINVNIVPQWHPNGPNTRDAFESIVRGLDSTNSDWVLYFEDDAEISSYFGERALPIIETIKDDCGVISFFSCDVYDTRRNKNNIKLYEPESFAFSQCVAIRKEVVIAWKNMLIPWWDNNEKVYSRRAPDIALGQACNDAGYKVLVSLPNLTQHRAAPSAFGHDHNSQSKTYVSVPDE
jgi:hypothetical protein